jgi:hypothetical protein
MRAASPGLCLSFLSHSQVSIFGGLGEVQMGPGFSPAGAGSHTSLLLPTGGRLVRDRRFKPAACWTGLHAHPEQVPADC